MSRVSHSHRCSLTFNSPDWLPLLLDLSPNLDTLIWRASFFLSSECPSDSRLWETHPPLSCADLPQRLAHVKDVDLSWTCNSSPETFAGELESIPRRRTRTLMMVF